MKIKYPKGILADDNDKRSTIEFEQKQLVNLKSACLSVTERSGGSFKGHTFFLSSAFDWTIIEDEWSNLCLVPLKKTGD